MIEGKLPRLAGRKLLTATVALSAVAIGSVGLITTQNSVEGEKLAVAERTADGAASRGATDATSLSDAMMAHAARAEFGSPADDRAAATTTTSTSTTTSTVKPTTTTVKKVVQNRAPVAAAAPAAPKTESKPAAPKPAASSGVVGDDVWSKLAMCESGKRNWTAGPYYGYFQFLPSTWRSLGGTGLPSDHSYETQKSLAIALQARSGWGQWPVCSRKIGVY